MKPMQILGFVVLYAVLIALPHGLRYDLQDFLIFLTINVLVVCSYRLMTLTGEWSLIHVVMMGVGAYSSALLTKKAGLVFWLALPSAGIITALMALLLALPLFRMKQFYFLIGSFAAGEAIRLTWRYFQFFGGAKGIKLVPQAPDITLPGFGTVQLSSAIPYYYLVLVVVSVCLFLLYRLEHSRIGLTLHAVHWRDALAESVGVHTWRYRTLAFAVASFFVGIAGALLCHYIGTVNPDQFSIGIMVYVLVWVIVGGTRTFHGPIIGVVVLSLLNELFREAEELRPLIYGVLLIASIMYLPDGLESLPQRVRALLTRGRAAPGTPARH